ncbi:MAG: hypothetical protein PHT07_18605 [Paludibacter sp.]|nr:hypothetical protein [Paludibacter sp.]
MIHIVKIDDKTPAGKKIIKELRKYDKVVTFEDPADTGIKPERYVTGEEFRKTVKENLRKKFAEDDHM